MTRTSRTLTAIVAGCGLAIAVAAYAQQAERRIEIIRHVGPGAPGVVSGVAEAIPHIAPFPSGEHDIIIATAGSPGMPGGPGAPGHSAEIHAALAGPAGALSTPDMLLRHAQQLELSDDQTAALKGLVAVMRKMHVNTSAAIQLAEIDAEAAADVAQPNMDALEAAFEAVAKAHLDERMLPFRISREAREELAPGQLAKWDGLLAQRADAEAMHRAHASMMPSGMGRAAIGETHVEMGHMMRPETHGDREPGHGGDRPDAGHDRR